MKIDNTVRDKEICLMAKKKITLGEIARKFNMTAANVWRILKRNGVRRRYDGRVNSGRNYKYKNVLSERDRQIVVQYQSGGLIRSIAEEQDLSRQRIEQIIRREGSIARARKRTPSICVQNEGDLCQKK